MMKVNQVFHYHPKKARGAFTIGTLPDPLTARRL